MKKLFITLLAALFLAIPLLAQEQPKLTEKQKQIQLQFNTELEKLQKETEQSIVPLKAKKYDIDEAIKDIEKEANKRFTELKNKFDKLFAEAKEEKKDDTIKH